MVVHNLVVEAGSDVKLACLRLSPVQFLEMPVIDMLKVVGTGLLCFGIVKGASDWFIYVESFGLHWSLSAVLRL